MTETKWKAVANKKIKIAFAFLVILIIWLSKVYLLTIFKKKKDLTIISWNILKIPQDHKIHKNHTSLDTQIPDLSKEQISSGQR